MQDDAKFHYDVIFGNKPRFLMILNFGMNKKIVKLAFDIYFLYFVINFGSLFHKGTKPLISRFMTHFYFITHITKSHT